MYNDYGDKMKKLETLEEVIYYLKEYEIVVTISDKKKVFFRRKEDRIRVRVEGLSYSLNLEEFKNLYGNCTFYLYEKESDEIFIDKEKDDEYYSWWHK